MKASSNSSKVFCGNIAFKEIFPFDHDLRPNDLQDIFTTLSP